MSYEETIRAKHEFEDSFVEVLKILSVMDRRELELAAAKLGDGLRRDDCLDSNSALVTAKIISMILNLRARNELSQSKLMRIWLRRKKKIFARQIADTQQVPERVKYKKDLEVIRRQQEKQMEEHRSKVEAYKNQLNALPLWKQICKRPPAKAGGFGLRLKAGSIGRSADLHHIEVIVRFGWLLRLYVLLPNLVRHVPATSNPIAPRP